MQASSTSEPFIRFGSFELDLSSGELRKHGIKLKLAEQPFQILVMLLAHPGKVVAREELRKRLWPVDTFVDFEVGLNNAVLRLRNALGDSAETPRYVETVPRRGYRFVGAINGSASSTEIPAPLAGPHRLRAIWIGALICFAFPVLLIALNVRGWRDRLVVKIATPSIRSIAVLPLENLTGDPSQEYFADGMTDELITELGKFSGLRVVSRQSVMRYKGSQKLLPEIARDLNVDAVVEGSVLRAGNTVRISVQLLHGPTDRHLWADTYQRDLSDILRLQSDVARAVGEEIRVKLTPSEQLRLANVRPINPEAYEAYLKGRYFWNKRTEAALKKGIEYFEEAIKKDPRYALAYTGLADSYSVLGFFGALPPRDAYPGSKTAALKALEIDNTLAEAHASLATNHLNYDWDWFGAEKEFRRAIELNPNYAMAHQWYALYLQAMGRGDERMVELKHAHELDPVALVIGGGDGSMDSGQYAQLIEGWQNKIEMDPSFAFAYLQLGQIYRRKGKHNEAIAEFRKAVRLSGDSPHYLGILGEEYGVAGKKAEAIDVLRELAELSKKRYVSSFYVALVYAGLGDKDRAFEWLEKAYDERATLLVLLKTDDKFDNLRSDPRFADLMRRIGLPP